MYVTLALMFVHLVVIWVWNAKCGIIRLCIRPMMSINGGTSHIVKVMFHCDLLYCISCHARLLHRCLFTCSTSLQNSQ